MTKEQVGLAALTAIAASATFLASIIAMYTGHEVVSWVFSAMCGGHLYRWFGLVFFGLGGD